MYWYWEANTYISAEKSHNKSFMPEYFTLGGVCWSWKANTYMQAERTSNKNSFEREYLGGF